MGGKNRERERERENDTEREEGHELCADRVTVGTGNDNVRSRDALKAILPNNSTDSSFTGKKLQTQSGIIKEQ